MLDCKDMRAYLYAISGLLGTRVLTSIDSSLRSTAVRGNLNVSVTRDAIADVIAAYHMQHTFPSYQRPPVVGRLYLKLFTATRMTKSEENVYFVFSHIRFI